MQAARQARPRAAPLASAARMLLRRMRRHHSAASCCGSLAPAGAREPVGNPRCLEPAAAAEAARREAPTTQRALGLSLAASPHLCFVFVACQCAPPFTGPHRGAGLAAGAPGSGSSPDTAPFPIATHRPWLGLGQQWSAPGVGAPFWEVLGTLRTHTCAGHLCRAFISSTHVPRRSFPVSSFHLPHHAFYPPLLPS